MAETEKAFMIAEREQRHRAAFRALFDALLEYADAQGDTEDAQKFIDDHARIVWLAGLDGRGPDSELLLWLAEHPEIWRKAMPDDVVIVPRQMLETIVKATIGASAVEALESAGNHLLMQHAHVAMRARAIDEEREPERIREHLIRTFTPKDTP